MLLLLFKNSQLTAPTGANPVIIGTSNNKATHYKPFKAFVIPHPYITKDKGTKLIVRASTRFKMGVICFYPSRSSTETTKNQGQNLPVYRVKVLYPYRFIG